MHLKTLNNSLELYLKKIQKKDFKLNSSYSLNSSNGIRNSKLVKNFVNDVILVYFFLP